jgi:hypothetical protein
MKTMMSVDGKKIIRISDEKASQLYHEGFRFIPKSMWKEQVRDIDKPTEEEPTKKKNNKMSRATKRHLRKSNK